MSRLFIPPFSNKMSRCPDMNNLCGPSRHIYICCTFLWFLVMFGDFWWDLLLVAIMCWLIGVHFISDHIRVTLDIHTTRHSNEQKVVHLPPQQCSVDNASYLSYWYMLERAFSRRDLSNCTVSGDTNVSHLTSFWTAQIKVVWMLLGPICKSLMILSAEYFVKVLYDIVSWIIFSLTAIKKWPPGRVAATWNASTKI